MNKDNTNKKKHRKFLLSLLILLCVGTVGSTGYAVATGQLPPIINSVVKIFTGDNNKNKANENVQPPAEINMENTSSEISPDGIEGTKSITHKQENSDDEFEYGEYENDNSMYSNTDTVKFESEPVTITTDTSQDTTSQPSIPAPTVPINKPTNNLPIPLPAPDVPAVKPIPGKPTVPPVPNAPKSNGGKSSSARHGHKKASISSVTLDKTEIALTKGEVFSHLVATVTPTNATGDKTITWTSKNDSVATVDKDGNITAVGAGTTSIVATTSNGKNTECKVTVLVPPSGIKINSDNFAIDKGLSKTLTATVEPEDCTDKAVTWATSNSDVLSVDDNGKVTAVTPGTAMITATTSDEFSSSCEVTVVISIAKLELNKSETTLIKGTDETLTATITPPDTTENKKIQWISSDENICTVDENGKITAVNGGTATITAQVGSHVAECEVTVIVPVSGVEINKSELRIAKDTEETLTANILPEDATNKAVEWSSSNPEIANVDENGKVTGIEVGTAVITVKTHDGDFTADCTVNVVIPVTGIKLDKTELNIIRKDSAVLIPTITPDNATDKSVIWSSSNDDIAIVDNDGKVTGTGVGFSVIKATTNDGGFTAECKITVTPDEYTITANAEHGKIVGAGTHHVGTDVTLKAVPDAHYHFVNWTYDGKEISIEPTYVMKNLNKDMSITANFEIDYHKVIVKAGEGGTVKGGGKFAYGAEIRLTAAPNDKYEFVKWSDGNTDSNRTYTVTGDISLTGMFKHKAISYTSSGSAGMDNTSFYIKSNYLDADINFEEPIKGVTSFGFSLSRQNANLDTKFWGRMSLTLSDGSIIDVSVDEDKHVGCSTYRNINNSVEFSKITLIASGSSRVKSLSMHPYIVVNGITCPLSRKGQIEV